MPGKMPRKKQERQPLLLSNNEPVNDVYDRPTQPRPDIRNSPDNVVVHLSSSPMEGIQTPEGNMKADPVLNRNLEHPTSNMDTMIHLLKGNIGVGILAMPNAFSHAGLAVGGFGTLLMGVICTHCMHILVNCAHELCRRTHVSSLGFPEVVETSFSTGPLVFRGCSKNAKRLVNLFLCITQLGFCCSYFVFVAANLKEVIGTYWVQLDVHAWLAILLVPMILLNWIKNLKYLAPVSMFAALLTTTGLGITFFYMVRGLPKTSSVRMVAPWHELPLFFGTAIYAFEGIGVVLPLENNMANPQDFGGYTGVLNTGMGIVAVLYTSVGFFGYLKYGSKVHGSITLDLPAFDMMAQSVRLVMAFAIFMSYGLQFYVPMNIMWPFVKERLSSEKAQFYGEYVMRTLLVILTFTLASVIHDLGSVISLVGAVSSSALALMFPPLIEILTFWDEGYGCLRWMVWKNIAIIIFGFIGFIFGTYVSISNIMNGTTG